LITNSNFKELSPQQMLELDSTQIEDYIRILSQKRKVTSFEEKELKKIRRQIKNREYAQSSRDKKKQQMDEIEVRLNDALAENKKLAEENSVLKQNLNLVADASLKDPEISNRLKKLAPNLNLNCAKAQTPPSFISNAQHQLSFSVSDSNSFVPNVQNVKSSSGQASKRVKTSVGVVSLFVVGIAFAFFLNNLSNLPTQSSHYVSSGVQNWRTGRVILSLERWYHKYVPPVLHPYFDNTFSWLFDEALGLDSEQTLLSSSSSSSMSLLNDDKQNINGDVLKQKYDLFSNEVKIGEKITNGNSNKNDL